MRHSINYFALSLLAAAFAGCSSNDNGTTSTASSYNPDLPGALAKYNAALVPLTNPCTYSTATPTALAYTLEQKEILVLSVRSVDLAILANGNPCYATNGSGATTTTLATAKTVKTLNVTGDTTLTDTSLTSEAVILDLRNGSIAPASATAVGTTITLNGSAVAPGDEIAVLGTVGTDKWSCKQVDSDDGIFLTGKASADILPRLAAGTSTPNHFVFDLNSGDDTFDQADCRTSMAVYGSAGKDTITVGSLTTTVGDIFSGGTDGTSAAESVDTIIFSSARTRGVTVLLDGIANDGDGNGKVEQDNFLPDFEVINGTPYNDVLSGGNLMVGPTGAKYSSYTLNGLAGNDWFSSYENFGTKFVGGTGIDTVDYSKRSRAVTVTMDGVKADDGEMTAASSTGASLDNVGVDIENLVGSDYAGSATSTDDMITGNGSDNVIKPGAGNDVVIGGAGNDTMLAGRADGLDGTIDTFATCGTVGNTSTCLGNDGNDIFLGGAGVNTVDYSSRVTGSTNGSQGVVINLSCVLTSATSTVAQLLAASSTANCVSGWANGVAAGTSTVAASSTEADFIGNDVQNAVGTIGPDTIFGSNLTNSIWSMGGADYILSGGGSLDELDANAYTATALTGNGYGCTTSGACMPAGSSTMLTGANIPADCDCFTAKGNLCYGNTANNCYNPQTGATSTNGVDGTSCDCPSWAAASSSPITTICDPSDGLPVGYSAASAGSSTAFPLADFQLCEAGTYDRGTCTVPPASPFTMFDFGGSVNMITCTCTGGSSTAQFATPNASAIWQH